MEIVGYEVVEARIPESLDSGSVKDEDSYSNCLAERKEEYEKEIGEEKDGI